MGTISYDDIRIPSKQPVFDGKEGRVFFRGSGGINFGFPKHKNLQIERPLKGHSVMTGRISTVGMRDFFGFKIQGASEIYQDCFFSGTKIQQDAQIRYDSAHS